MPPDSNTLPAGELTLESVGKLVILETNPKVEYTMLITQSGRACGNTASTHVNGDRAIDFKLLACFLSLERDGLSLELYR